MMRFDKGNSVEHLGGKKKSQLNRVFLVLIFVCLCVCVCEKTEQ